ncbi:Trp biosynthesis-associated membrane protein [Leifsonia sp. F6_8S_P_1B]|uniref:Trp biosynthesis-associated membrane protein n=1 Tax=Leifsonia williamsii TaxID=3035919 RepID=A0ABT8KEM8_9MICO|nr:Trp biosynthesis-associated membrane protein [Leifsonia williamsii]MDN4615448.1 Trp biosynthesis-associated membrane protein [Leifsonia williamsii]
MAEPAPAPSAERAARIRGRRAKYLTLLVIVVASGLVLLAATQTWFSVALTDTAEHGATLTVAGSAAAPALTALALAGLALTAALAIAGPVFRIVLALLGVLLGGSILFSAGSALADPLRASSSAVTTATGVAGESSVARLVHGVDTSLWPWAAILGGVLLILGSAAAVVLSRLWPGSSRKYETRFQTTEGGDAAAALAAAAAAAEADERAADAAVSDDAEARAVAEGETEAGPASLDRDTAIDSWDDLSRGDDPTR